MTSAVLAFITLRLDGVGLSEDGVNEIVAAVEPWSKAFRTAGTARGRSPAFAACWAVAAPGSLTGAPSPRRCSTQAARVVAQPMGIRPADRSAHSVGRVRTGSLADPSAAILASWSLIRGLEKRVSRAAR